jgi:4-hydroxy-tetrahydrodipicolinate synthase
MYLYNFPAMSGVMIGVDVVARLIDRYPAAIAGLKDSSGDWEYEKELLDRFSGMAVFCGQESLLPRLMTRGGAGAISGMANVVPGLVRRLFDERSGDDSDPMTARMTALAGLLSDVPLTPAIRALAAHTQDEPNWRRVRPPLMPLDEVTEQRLITAFVEAGGTVK